MVVIRLVECGDKRDDDFGDDCCGAAEKSGVYTSTFAMHRFPHLSDCRGPQYSDQKYT
jgi:hypothetical protein